MASFADRLRELRKTNQLGQKEVGAIIGVSDSSIRKYESGERTPTPEAIVKLARFFEVTTDYLLGFTDDPTAIKSTAEQKKPKDLRKILEQHEIMFDGVPLSEESKQDILHIIEFDLYKRAKAMNKRKPKEGDHNGK